MNLTDYLTHWKNWLLALCKQNVDEIGTKIKYERQLQAIQDFSYGVAANMALCFQLIDLYENKKESSSITKACDKAQKERRPLKAIQPYFKASGCSRDTVELALASPDLFLIQGPPGTGKTTVIAEIILQTLENNPKANVVICSETHAAVDNALFRVDAYRKPNSFSMMRYPEYKFTESAPKGTSYHEVMDNWLVQKQQKFPKLSIELWEKWQFLEDKKSRPIDRYICENINLLGITCNQLARFKFNADDKPYDLVIIDEVSKATLPEILIPLLKAKKVILVGDPMQLPPTFCQEEYEEMKKLDADEEDVLLKDSLVDRIYDNTNDILKSFLDTQYRMVDPIGTVISHAFYKGRLKNGRNKTPNNCIQWLDYHTPKKFPVKSISNGGKLENYIEADLIKSTLEKIAAEKKKQSIAIITPYKAQKKLLKKSLSSFKDSVLQIEIDTIDAFQGREADVVFISFVRNTGSAKFYADERRLNVAISRVRDQLYIVGMKKYLLNKKINVLLEIDKMCNQNS